MMVLPVVLRRRPSLVLVAPVFACMMLFALVLFATTAYSADAPEITVKPASQLFVRPVREAMAVVQARNETVIAAQVSAVISEVLVDVGRQVKAGDILARLDDTDIRLSLGQTKAGRDGLRARMNLAQSQLKRLRDLKTNNFVSTEAVNQRLTEVVSLKAELKGSDVQLAIIRRQLDKCVIRAPFNGVVSQRRAQLGALAAAGSPLFTLVEIGGEEIQADISAADAPQLNSKVKYLFHSHGQQAAVRLDRLSPIVSRPTRTRTARFSFTGDSLPAGTEGRLRWPDSRGHLPPSVIVRRNNMLGVFLLTGDIAKFTPLAAAQEGRPVAVNLPPDAQVVVDGQDRLQDGDKVRVQAAQPQ